jgi:hypothetical protein
MDKDHDGSYTMIQRAVQTSGTGTLTNAAWITYAKATQAQGQALRAIRVNRPYRIGADDLLETPSLVSVGVPTAGMSYPVGMLSGAAPFVVQEAPGTTPASFSATLSWTCGTPTPAETVLAEPGFTFTLPSLGCPLTWPQKFVVRPEPVLAPTELVFSIYGAMTDQVAVPLQVVGQSRTFDYTYGDVHLAGELLAWGSNGATLRLDNIAFRGVSACQAGTYNLPPE